MKYFLLIMTFVSLGTFAQVTTTIDFDTSAYWNGGAAVSGYGAHTYDQGVFSMSSNNVFRETTALQDGFAAFHGIYAVRVRNVAGSFALFQIASGGVSSFNVNLRRWDNTPSPNMNLQYSIDGGSTWTLVSNINNTNLNDQSDYVNFSASINSSNTNILIELINMGTGSEERVMIDDFQWTDNSNPACNLAASGLTGLTCNDAGTTSIPADDYLTFDLDPTGSLLGTTYTVSVPTGTITPTSGTYGAATTFQLQAGSAGAGNVTVTITDDTDGGCTLDQVITDPGACSSATPVITLTPATLTGFNHIVGTPSAEQTFTASGLGLSGDITIAAPANFEISLTTGTGFTNSITLTQTSGSVAATTIHTRANAPAMGMLTGDIIATSTGADNDTVHVTGYANDYVDYTVSDIKGTNANGVADSLNVLVSLVGVIQCDDYDYNAGYSFAMIDENGDGINIYRSSDLSYYTTPMDGDSIIVRGKVLQFNGLLEVQADSIQLVGTGVTATPMVVTTLGEATESMPIQVMNLTLVTPIATFTAGANLDATDGTNTISIRIPTGSPLDGVAAPQGLFHVTGIGWQYDSSSPFDSGYQLYPCSFEDACTTPSNATTLTDPNTATATATGVTYQWIDCSDNSEIANATSQSYTAFDSGSYAVIVTDGACSDTSDCVNLAGTSGINEYSILSKVNVYPNPVNDVLTISNSSDAILSYSIVDMNGKQITESATVGSMTTISTSNWNKGVYFVRFNSENGQAILRVIK